MTTIEELAAPTRVARDPVEVLKSTWREDMHPRDPRSGRWVVRVDHGVGQWAAASFEDAAREVADAKLRGAEKIEAFKLSGDGATQRPADAAEVQALVGRATELIVDPEFQAERARRQEGVASILADYDAMVGRLRKEFVEDEHPRNRLGRWVKKFGNLPILPWQDPPPPQGVPGRPRGGFAADGRTVTAVGDLGEKIVEQLGLVSQNTRTRQGALDVTLGDFGYEVKARTTLSQAYKVGMRTKDMRRKRRAARDAGLHGGIIMVVIDPEAARAWIYHRYGIENGRLSPDDYAFAGIVDL